MNLPLELIEIILRLLPVRQVLTLRELNKNWYSIVNKIIKNLKTDKLVISDTWNFKESWFPSFEPVDYDHLIKIDDFDLFKLKREHIFSRINSLFIYSTKQKDESEFKLVDQINRLVRLETLTIYGLNLRNEENEIINLESLRTLDVDKFKCNNIILNTPNLENFRIFDHWLSKFTFNYPLSMKTIFIDQIFGNCIEDFSNLEYFYLNHVYNPRLSFLQELPLLKELHFESFCTWDSYETILESMVLNERTDFKPFMFGVNFDGLEYDDDDRVDDFYTVNKSNIKYFKEHPERTADKLRFIETLFYNDLESMYDKIPPDLIDKFVCLKCLEIKGSIKNEPQLIDTLRCLSKRVMTLNITNSSLGQDFYDRLPSSIQILDQLIIANDKINDFSFLLKFENIRGFQTDQYVSTEIVDSFIAKNKEVFKYFNYKENSNPVRIRRTDDGKIATERLEIRNYDEQHLNSYDLEMELDNLFDS